ncbi:MAG TPA: TetR/AcrR family transcriptional regulator [Sphingobium sp.]|uniref:TetR/AcrR family transcriptional regulator n=1 Tax=Sphingobium sp. TaxID=1912891 RepID=UPI002ED4F3B3
MTVIATSLRDDQRALTRKRIVEAAKLVFARSSYSTATIDEILRAANVSRSTLYVYFRDKDDILAQISADFTVGFLEIARELRGPLPSQDDIDLWMRKMADFMHRERVPTILLAGLSSSGEAPMSVLRQLGTDVIEALAEQMPAFHKAIEPDPGQPLAHAWATVVMREVSWACRHFALDPDSEANRCLMQVAGEMFRRLVHENA